MIFHTCSVTEAEGAVLAHSVRVGAVKFKKGRVLSEPDIQALKDAGVHQVTVARLEDGDVPEDEAAAHLATAIADVNVDTSAVFTGRANLYAAAAGLVRLDATAIQKLNGVHESITLATLDAYARVAPRDMLATIKIIPFAAPLAAVEQAEAIEAKISVSPFRTKSVGLISTELPGTKASVIDKSAQTIRSRLEPLGSSLTKELRCAHQPDALATSIQKTLQFGCEPILIFGASAIVDRRDVIPAAIEKAGGRIIHFGMPVDPGNLLLLAELDEATIIGLPGCARSPKLNGFDWVLERCLADVPITSQDIAAMGVGGLLKEIAIRPQPRDGLVPDRARAKAPKIAAIILAAGQSRRMGSTNKLLAKVDGVSMVRKVTETVLAAKLDELVLVTGHEPKQVVSELSDLEFNQVHNPEFADGLSTSLRTGLSGLSEDVDAVLVCLGDMPLINSSDIEKLVAAFDPDEGRAICVPVFGGKRGNPVLWARSFFEDMRHAAGDSGAKHLIGENEGLVCDVDVANPGILRDFDTPEALAQFDSSIASQEQ